MRDTMGQPKLTSQMSTVSTESTSGDDLNQNLPSEIKVTPKRYLILFLFCLLSSTNSFQWIQYSIIADIVTSYYNVPSIAVDATSVIYMAVYIPLIIPATFVLSKKGLRYSILIGSFGNFLGSAIKCFSVHPNYFYVTLFGQLISGISQIFVLNIPPSLASIWFPNHELSTATAIGVFGNQIGIALGFIIPTYLVRQGDKLFVSQRLAIMYERTAVVTAVTFILILFLFEKQPKNPPSLASKKGSGSASVNNSYSTSLKYFFTNCNFILLMLSYGVNSGVLYAISTLLNQIVIIVFPGNNSMAGEMGLIATISGIIGATIGGVILDKTKKYKLVTVITYASCLLSVLLLTAILKFATSILWPMYIAAFSFGFFLTGYLPIGFELAAEITFPEPEGTSAGLLNFSAQILGVLMTFGSSLLIKSVGVIWLMIVYCLFLVFGLIATIFIKEDLKRLEAEREGLKNIQNSENGNYATFTEVN